MTTAIQLHCRAVLDDDGSWERANFVFQWGCLQPLNRWSTLQHSAPLQGFSSGCKSVSRAVTAHNRVTETSPLRRTFQFCSRRAEYLFQIHLKHHKGIPRWMQQYLCCSPKINALVHNSSCLCVLKLNAEHGQCSNMLEVAAAITALFISLIMLSFVMLRVSGSSTGIEWVQRKLCMSLRRQEIYQLSATAAWEQIERVNAGFLMRHIRITKGNILSSKLKYVHVLGGCIGADRWADKKQISNT